MRLRLICSLGVATALGLPAGAGAAPILDRVQVGVPGNPATRGYDDALSVALIAPDGYGRGCCYNGESGEWLGPRYAASADPSVGGPSRIGWGVTFARTRRSSASLARSAGWAELPEVTRGSRRVAHIVGGRAVGGLRASYALDAAAAPGARVQAAMAVQLRRRVRAVVVFDLSEPAADDGGALGSFTVGGLPASSWNRERAGAALAGVFVEGNLPPSRVRARARGARVRGSVSDALGHPVGEARVTLERRAGRSWLRIAEATTSTRGNFSLRATRRGSYRVVATFGGTTAKSRTFKAAR